MNDSKICKDAVSAFGIESQKRMAVEECAELINALMKESRGRVSDDDIITEIADVQIMMEQLSQIYGKEKVTRERHRKLCRLKKRILATLSPTLPATRTDKTDCAGIH